MGISKSEAEAFIDGHLIPLNEINSNCFDPYQKYTEEWDTWGRRSNLNRTVPKPNESDALKRKADQKPDGLLELSGLTFLNDQHQQPERNIDHAAYFTEHEKYWHSQEQSEALKSIKQKNPDITTLIDKFNLKTDYPG